MATITAQNFGTVVLMPDDGPGHQKISAPNAISSAAGANFPVPIGAVLAGGTLGIAYSETISAQGGTSPYTFSLQSGALPTSLSISSGGAISGTPTVTGTSTFIVKVTDSNTFTGTQSFSITIAAAAAVGVSNYGSFN